MKQYFFEMIGYYLGTRVIHASSDEEAVLRSKRLAELYNSKLESVYYHNDKREIIPIYENSKQISYLPIS